MLQPLWTIGPVFALKFWPGLIDDRWGTYALVTVLLSYPYCRKYLLSFQSHYFSRPGHSGQGLTMVTSQTRFLWAGHPKTPTTLAREPFPRLYTMYVPPLYFALMHSSVSDPSLTTQTDVSPTGRHRSELCIPRLRQAILPPREHKTGGH